MLNSSEKTKFCFVPSYDMRVLYLSGVSGSIRPLRKFVRIGSLSLPLTQRGLFVHGPTSGVVSWSTKVLPHGQ